MNLESHLPPPTRFHVELSASGLSGIRDAETGELHRTRSVSDAAYLNSQDEHGNVDEIRTHLASLAHVPGNDDTEAGGYAAPLELVLAAAEEWAGALDAAEAAVSMRQRAAELASARTALQTAESATGITAAYVGSALRTLYEQPEAAHLVLSETARQVPLPDLADLVDRSPALFGSLAPLPRSRFGPAAAAAAVAERATALASSLLAYDGAGSELASARNAAAARLRMSPDDPTLAESLDERISALTTARLIHPHYSVDRAANRFRALFAAASEKTKSAILRVHPLAAELFRDAAAVLPRTQPQAHEP